MADLAVARQTVAALQAEIDRIEGRGAVIAAARSDAAWQKRQESADPVLPLGIAEVDERLQGGLPSAGLVELRSERLSGAGAASGFALAVFALMQARLEAKGGHGRLIWIADAMAGREAGLPYAAGLEDFGLQPESLLYAASDHLEETLWLTETALASGAFSAAVLEICGNPRHFGLTESRRLHLRAREACVPLFLVRQGGEEEASSALLRLNVVSAPCGLRALADGSRLEASLGHPAFRLAVEKSHHAIPAEFELEWNPDDRQFFRPASHAAAVPVPAGPAHSGAGVSASADGSHRPQALGSVLAFDRAS